MPWPPIIHLPANTKIKLHFTWARVLTAASWCHHLRVQYSQPTTFFRIPARQSLNIGQTIGFGSKYGWRWDQYSIPMVFISEDIVIFSGKKWYYANGAGVGLQAQQNERLGAKLLFQFKMIGGYKLNDRTNIELFMQHFSNANTARENYSYAFYGLGVTYNF